MAVSQRGNRDVITAVYIERSREAYYVWSTKDFSSESPGISDSDLTTLGHLKGTSFPGQQGQILFLNSNAPKPARYKKKTTSTTANTPDTISTYGSIRIDGVALFLAGWSLEKPAKTVTQGTTAKGYWVAAEIGRGGATTQIWRAWNLSKNYFDLYGQTLRLRKVADVPTSDFICVGTNRPKPAQVVRTATTNKGIKMFASYNADLGDDWRILVPEVATIFG